MKNIQYYVCYLIILISCLDMFATNNEDCSAKTLDEYPMEDKKHNNTKLLLISMLFRHGDRTPDAIYAGESYPNDPHKNIDYYPDSRGLLTKVGKRRAFELGRFLRKTYNSYLGDIYYPPNVYARSTVVPRTKMTLQLVLAGLYPPVDYRQKWHPQLNWQPFDMSYAPHNQDGLFFPFLCKKYHEAKKKFLETESGKNITQTYQTTMDLLSKLTHKTFTSIRDLANLYALFSMYSSMRKSLPSWYNKTIENQLSSAAVLFFSLSSHSKELQKLYGGTLLYRILQDMWKVINGTLRDRKINLFSGHDVNVAEVLVALGIFDGKIPEYTSGVVVELHEANQKYFVQVQHYLGIPPILVKAKLPNCSELCPIDTYVELISSVTGSDDPACPLTIND